MDPHSHCPQAEPPLPLRSDRRPEAPEVVRHWLTTAHPTPQRAYAEWAEQGLALIPLGRRFNAIRIPSHLMCAAADSDAPDQVAGMLRNALGGPVINDHLRVRAVYYALVPYAPVRWLGANDIPLLGPGTHLGVPALERTAPPGTFWITPPRYRNHLCTHEAVFDLINTGRRNLRGGDGSTASGA